MSNFTDAFTGGRIVSTLFSFLPKKLVASLAASLASLMLVSAMVPSAEARHHKASASHASKHGRSHSGGHSAHASGRSSSRRHGRISGRSSGRYHVSSRSGRHHLARGRGHQHHHAVAHAAAKPRYAYPIGLFMRSAPSFDSTPFDGELAGQVSYAFDKGLADSYPARSLVRAGVVKFHPLHGGIFWRREPVKYIVMHSTETGVPVSAWRVIEGWSGMGLRHPGAQYVVDRDGTIYQAVDPDLATVHVNIFKTLPGINNDNSIGIEINHTGSQDYPAAQMASVNKLVVYLQHRYNVMDDNIITHRYAQQGDHTDPVNFDWGGFIANKNSLRNQAIAYRENHIKDDARRWRRDVEVPINTYLKPHSEMGDNGKTKYGGSSSAATAVPAVLTPVSPVAGSSGGAVPAYGPAPESSGKFAPAPVSGSVSAPALVPVPAPAPSPSSTVLPAPASAPSSGSAANSSNSPSSPNSTAPSSPSRDPGISAPLPGQTGGEDRQM